ncbi:hypothetical protein HZA56_18340 [Candidatus Poribacteria bacterium]|jgi:uncharacterized protein YqgV (UPF0045/DUF77 family)|nr:hypothetical protein [Candidatus Poribacteria bacterium]
MVFEFIFPYVKNGNGFSSYVESLAPESGVDLIENCPSATVVEGDWETAMGFLRHCQEYIAEHAIGSLVPTTIHIHS